MSRSLTVLLLCATTLALAACSGGPEPGGGSSAAFIEASRTVTAEGVGNTGAARAWAAYVEGASPDEIPALLAGLDEVGPLSAIIRGDHGQVTFVAPFHATDTIVIDDTTTSFEAASLHHQVNEVNRCLRAGVTESARNPWATTRAILAWCDEILAELGVVYPAGC